VTTVLASEQSTTWTIDAAHSAAEFSAKHMMITTVKGRIAEVRGAITVDEENPGRSTVDVELGAASIDTTRGVASA
jgi:polyisoprenoid-binding protein YceI